MDVEIVTFRETLVACVEHRGPPELEHQTARKLIAWKIENCLVDSKRHRHYGLHYTNPNTIAPYAHHVDFCLSIDGKVGPNPYGIVSKLIPSLRCARAQDIGSRSHNQAAVFLHTSWLPQSGELVAEFPMIFHYVNVGPDVREEEMITDVYLPLV